MTTRNHQPDVGARQSAAAAPTVGLRERKKQRTRQAIQREAMRLFDAQGYEATTIEQIAAAAEVSPSTFFRYYPTKEDVVLSDDYDPLVAAALLARPADEPLATSIRRALVDTMRPLLDEEASMLWTRSKLVLGVPSLRARIFEGAEEMREALAGALSERTGRPADDFHLNVLAGVVAGAMSVAAFKWLADDGRSDLVDLVEQMMNIIEPALRL